MDSEHGGIWADPIELKRKFWRDNVADRRKALFPFLWSAVAKQGEIFGNRAKGSVARVTNGMAFSYPGNSTARPLLWIVKTLTIHSSRCHCWTM
jgi:hypothetical protein